MGATLRTRIAERPVGAFFILTFLISWTLMTPGMIVGLDSLAAIPFFIGVYGPATAAAIVTRAEGGSIRVWLRSIFRWRVGRRWYVLAFVFPFALAIVATAEFALAGQDLDFGMAGENAASIVPYLIFCLLINGGPEEPGWRGFALPRLQERMSPVRATITLGIPWGLWHFPLLLAVDNPDHNLTTPAFIAMLAWTLGGIVAYAFTYTYMWNKTRSIVICMLLHASYNTALGTVILRPENEQVGEVYVTLSLAITGTLWLAVAGLIWATKGRLGLEPGAPAPPAPTGLPEQERRGSEPVLVGAGSSG